MYSWNFSRQQDEVIVSGVTSRNSNFKVKISKLLENSFLNLNVENYCVSEIYLCIWYLDRDLVIFRKRYRLLMKYFLYFNAISCINSCYFHLLMEINKNKIFEDYFGTNLSNGDKYKTVIHNLNTFCWYIYPCFCYIKWDNKCKQNLEEKL